MSNEPFRLGDVVEIVRASHANVSRAASPYVGQQGTIKVLSAKLHLYDGPMHAVEMRDGEWIAVTENCMRKVRPPPTREQTSTWDDLIVWKPREVEHV